MEETASSSEEAPKNSKGLGTVVVIVIIVLIVIAGFVGYSVMNSQKNKPATDQTVVPTPTTPAAIRIEPTVVATEAAARPFTVTGANFSFTPNTITAKKGEKVTITFKSIGGFHNFALDELNVKTQVLGTGKEETVTFTPTKTGTFEFYCSVGNHRAMGMVGKLIVQ